MARLPDVLGGRDDGDAVGPPQHRTSLRPPLRSTAYSSASLVRTSGAAVRSVPGVARVGGYRLWRVAEPSIPAGEPGVRVTFEEAATDSYASAFALAKAFGSTVLEPSWWPAGIEEISYRVARFSSGHLHHEIMSVRRDGVPVGVIGQLEIPGDRSPREWLDGDWSEPHELAHVRGLIGRVGSPPRLQAVVYHAGLEIRLVGYDTEDEIMRVVSRLRPVSPE